MKNRQELELTIEEITEEENPQPVMTYGTSMSILSLLLALLGLPTGEVEVTDDISFT